MSRVRMLGFIGVLALAAIGATATTFAAPRGASPALSNRRVNTTMTQKWEYWTMRVNQLELTDAQVMNAMMAKGNEGWELAGVSTLAFPGNTQTFLLFKRPKQ